MVELALAAKSQEKAAALVYFTMGRRLARAVETDCASLNVRPVKARAGTGKDPIAGEELICPFSTRPDAKSGVAPSDGPFDGEIDRIRK